MVWQSDFNPLFFIVCLSVWFMRFEGRQGERTLPKRAERQLGLCCFLRRFINDWESHMKVKSISLCGKTTNVFSHFQAVPNTTVWFPIFFFSGYPAEFFTRHLHTAPVQVVWFSEMLRICWHCWLCDWGDFRFLGKKKIMFSDEMKNWKRKFRQLSADIQMLCFFLLLGHFHT